MGWKVIFSFRSQQDIQKIVESIAHDDPGAAERFGFELILKAESLANAPEMGVAQNPFVTG